MLLTRELIYQGTRYPLAALIRSYKFMDRGWQRPHAGHMLVLTQELAGLNWNDPHTWYDQLTGVDFAYFHEVIARIRKLLGRGCGHGRDRPQLPGPDRRRGYVRRMK